LPTTVGCKNVRTSLGAYTPPLLEKNTIFSNLFTKQLGRLKIAAIQTAPSLTLHKGQAQRASGEGIGPNKAFTKAGWMAERASSRAELNWSFPVG